MARIVFLRKEQSSGRQHSACKASGRKWHMALLLRGLALCCWNNWVHCNGVRMREEHWFIPQPVPSPYTGLNTATLVMQTSSNPLWVYLGWENRPKNGIPNLNVTIKTEVHLHLRIIQHSKPPTFLQVALRTQSIELTSIYSAIQ
jgi:hypothetical protein